MLELQHSTKEQLISRVRDRFAMSVRLEVWRIAALIKTLVDNEDLTLQQVKTAFGMPDAEFNELGARIEGYRTKYYELKNAVGE